MSYYEDLFSKTLPQVIKMLEEINGLNKKEESKIVNLDEYRKVKAGS